MNMIPHALDPECDGCGHLMSAHGKLQHDFLPVSSPKDSTMSASKARSEIAIALLRRARLYVESVEVQPTWGDGSRHLESDAARELRVAIDDFLKDARREE